MYVDDGFGGPFTMVFDGANYPSTYQFKIDALTCGLNYFVKVSAINTAGEGAAISQSQWLGTIPSEPLEPVLLSVTPDL